MSEQNIAKMVDFEEAERPFDEDSGFGSMASAVFCKSRKNQEAEFLSSNQHWYLQSS